MENLFCRKRSPLVVRTFLSILVPTIFMNLTTAVGSMADAVIIGQYLDDLSLSVVTYATPIYMIINTVAALFAVGGCIAMSVDTGKGDKLSANRSFSIALECLCALSAILFVAGVFFSGPITVMLGAGNELVFDKVKTYVKIILVGAPVFILNISSAFFVRNDGRANRSMVGMLLSIGVDITFNLVFVGFMHMGVAGAALSTVLGQSVGLVVIGSHFFSKKNTLKFCFAFDSSVFRIIKNGFGSALGFVYQFLTIIILNHYVIKMAGPEGMVIYTVVFNLGTVSLSVFEGLSQTIQPMVSLYYGERSNKKIKESVKLAIISAIIICGSVMILLEVFPGVVPHIFGIGEAAIVSKASQAVRIYATSMFIMTVNVIIGNYLQSVELGGVAGVLISLRSCILLLVSAFFLGRIFGINGIWAAYCVAEILTFLVFAVINTAKRKKLSCDNANPDVFFLDKNIEEKTSSHVFKCNSDDFAGFSEEIKAVGCKTEGYSEQMLAAADDYLRKLRLAIEERSGKYIEVEFNRYDRKIIICDNLDHKNIENAVSDIKGEGFAAEYGPVIGLNRICLKGAEKSENKKTCIT